MIKLPINCPYVIGEFEQHAELKQDVLNAINEQEVQGLQESEDAVNITRSDWESSRWDYNKKWLHLLGDHFHNHLLKVSKELGYEFYRLKEIWFQQYADQSYHGWHVHGANWTSVYYLDLPDGSPQTEYIVPYEQTDVQTFDIKEGQTITFPSFVVHRAPINNNDKIKTIISWNMDTEIVPGLYSE
jgi:hypothetical protein